MKINKMSEENSSMEWMFNNKDVSNYMQSAKKDLDNVAKVTSKLSDADVVKEKERIEKCASENSTYFYSSNLPQEIKSELKEYSQACGLKDSKFKSVSQPKDEIRKASNEKMTKTASSSKKLVLNDPFKLDEKLNEEDKKQAWSPKIQLAEKLDEKPAMSGIVAIRGGENYFENSDQKVARGTNSITDPNAIDKLANSSKEDTGARLRRENKEKQNRKIARHNEWQKEKVDTLKKNDAVPGRKIFPTESLNAQPGIKGEVFDYTNLPEKTEGESIKDKNEDRKNKISRESKQKHEFKVEKNPTRQISEDFNDQLKKFLKK